MKKNEQIQNDMVEAFYTWWSERIIGVAEDTPKELLLHMFIQEVIQVAEKELAALENQSFKS